MKVTLGKFARSGIESQVGGDVAAGVQAALTHYASRPDSVRASLPAPRFLRELLSSEQEGLVELKIGPAMLRCVEWEAQRQSRTVDEIAEHAVLVYLADLDEAATRRAA